MEGRGWTGEDREPARGLALVSAADVGLRTAYCSISRIIGGIQFMVFERLPCDGGPIPAHIKCLVRSISTEVRLLQYNLREEIAISTKKIGAIYKILE